MVWGAFVMTCVMSMMTYVMLAITTAGFYLYAGYLHWLLMRTTDPAAQDCPLEVGLSDTAPRSVRWRARAAIGAFVLFWLPLMLVVAVTARRQRASGRVGRCWRVEH